MTGCVYVGVLLKHCTVSRSGKRDNGHPPPVSKGLLAASCGKNWRELPDLQIWATTALSRALLEASVQAFIQQGEPAGYK